MNLIPDLLHYETAYIYIYLTTIQTKRTQCFFQNRYPPKYLFCPKIQKENIYNSPKNILYIIHHEKHGPTSPRIGTPLGHDFERHASKDPPTLTYNTIPGSVLIEQWKVEQVSLLPCSSH